MSSTKCEKSLPRAEIVELGEDDDVEEVLRKAAKRAEVLAVGGGDGTVSCAAGVAVEAGVPLAVFPGGTFNHFAKDIGCDTRGQDRRRNPARAASPASTWSASTRATW